MTPPHVSKEGEPLGMSESEELPAIGVEEEEIPALTSPLSHPMKPPPSTMEVEWCGGGWSFPPPAYMREEERCDGG
jgi:hypothetical protein